jgi:ribosome-binding protein aMBF1 (putative translation factor)
MTWWTELDYPPFAKGRGGFPCTGQVVRHYREQKRDPAGRTWSQKDLARHLKITEHAVRDIERGAVGIDYARRHLLCALQG